MMEFKKYNSIENAYQDDFIIKVRAQGLHAGPFVVQEKVHGANLCLMTDGTTVTAARRNERLMDDEDFFNYRLLVRKYEQAVLDLFNCVAQTMPGLASLSVYGELFGGIYPHADVPRNKLAQAVQKGLYYAPDNDFYAFDILADNRCYLDVDTADQLFARFGFFYAKTLFRGTFDDCLRYPNNFRSQIPQWLGLPEIPGNICEGIVIRPVVPCFLKNGSRVIVKSKNERWAENNRYVDKNMLRLEREADALSDSALLLCEQAMALVTQNRLVNLIGKVGPVTRRDHGRLLGLYCQDVLADFMKTHHEPYGQLEKAESKAVNKFVNSHAAKLIADYLNAP